MTNTWRAKNDRISRLRFHCCATEGDYLRELNIYEYQDTSLPKDLKIKVFSQPSLEWMDFVINCRSDIHYQHEYDIVIGNIADDNVGETITFVMNGIMRKEDALQRLQFQQINNQICFNTGKGLDQLTFLESKFV